MYGAHNHDTAWSKNADGHWHACRNSGCTDKADFAAHTPNRAAATETESQKCTKCDYTMQEALGHHVVLVPAKEAKCLENGNIAYYKCGDCGKYFEDEAATVEITDHSSVIRSAVGHDWKAATCTNPKTCKRSGCGATEGTALGHDWKAATCTNPKTCKRSGCGATEGTALGHDWKAATCTNPKTCKRSECGATEGSALGHNYQWVIDRNATATEKGSKHEECTVCHDRKTAVEIPATGSGAGTATGEKSPHTGENNIANVWAAVLALSVLGTTGAVVYGKERKHSAK